MTLENAWKEAKNRQKEENSPPSQESTTEVDKEVILSAYSGYAIATNSLIYPYSHYFDFSPSESTTVPLYQYSNGVGLKKEA